MYSSTSLCDTIIKNKDLQKGDFVLFGLDAMASPEWKEHLDRHAKKIKDVETKYEAKGKQNKVWLLDKS